MRKPPPTLVDFSLDMNIGLLQLVFDETVNVSSLLTSGISLRSARLGGTSYTLTETSFSESENDFFLTINISVSDLNNIKLDRSLAQSSSDTYLSITSDTSTIRDMNNNPVTAIPTFLALQVQDSNYQPDMTSPNLVSYHLDMDEGILYLTFDETVDVSSLMFTDLTFYSEFNITMSLLESGFYSLTGGTLRTGDSHETSVQLLNRDQYNIKLIPNLATSLNDTYLLIDMSFIQDTAQSPNLVNLLMFPLQADSFTTDTTPPKLTSFTANLNLGLLILMFDEPVNASSINFDRFIVQSGNTGDFSEYQLTGGYTNSSNGRSITVYIPAGDLNEIKKIEDLLVSEETSYLRFLFEAVRDMAGNEISALNQSEAIQAMGFTDDVTRPVLLAFDLDSCDALPPCVDASCIHGRTSQRV